MVHVQHHGINLQLIQGHIIANNFSHIQPKFKSVVITDLKDKILQYYAQIANDQLLEILSLH